MTSVLATPDTGYELPSQVVELDSLNLTAYQLASSQFSTHFARFQLSIWQIQVNHEVTDFQVGQLPIVFSNLACY